MYPIRIRFRYMTQAQLQVRKPGFQDPMHRLYNWKSSRYFLKVILQAFVGTKKSKYIMENSVISKKLKTKLMSNKQKILV